MFVEMYVKRTLIIDEKPQAQDMKIIKCMEDAKCAFTSADEGWITRFNNKEDALKLAEEVKKIDKYVECTMVF